MKRLAILAVALVAVPLALSATAPSAARTGEIIYQPVPKPQCTAKAFRPFSDAVWRLIKWERGKPPQRVLEAQRRRLRCAGPANRRAMRHRWRKDKRAYFHRRRLELAARSRVRSTIDAVGMGTLEAIAACESGGNPQAVSPSGTYRGKYQFDYGTWESVGGHGDPAAASEHEQDYRAALLYLARGSAPWPVCG